MNQLYIVDSCSWSEYQKKFSPKKYPDIATGIEALIYRGRICSPYEVFNELVGYWQTDAWAKDHKGIFRHPTPKDVEALKLILKRHPDVATVNRLYDADPWLGAFALAHAQEQQGRLISTEQAVIVSEDTKAVRHICSSFKLAEPITIFDLLVLEGIISVSGKAKVV